jgi:hypothetical protein
MELGAIVHCMVTAVTMTAGFLGKHMTQWLRNFWKRRFVLGPPQDSVTGIPKVSGREPKGACCQDDLIGGKLAVVK